MLNFSKSKGAIALATGHYIKRQVINGEPQLFRAKDLSKDQSYFLFTTTNEQLSFLRFPLGELNKLTVRDLAKFFDLNVAYKPDSQDICFVPDGKYSNLVRKLRPDAIKKGSIFHVDGTYLGEHNGIIDYTIGQRKGIKVGGRKNVLPEDNILYVISIDDIDNKILVGPKKYLSCSEFLIDNCNWIVKKKPFDKDVLVKLRNTSNPVKGRINFDVLKKSINVKLNNNQYGISPGQAAVFYNLKNENHILGGGWIKKTVSNY